MALIIACLFGIAGWSVYVVSGPLIGSLSDTRGLNTTFLVLAGAFALLLPLVGRSFLHYQTAVEQQTAL